MGRPPGPSRVLPQSLVDQLRLLEDNGDREQANALLAVIAEAGWGYQASATAIGVTRQTVFIRVKDANRKLMGRFEVPAWEPKGPKKAVLTEEDKTELRELQESAHKLRPEHSGDHPYRLASEKLTEVIDAHTGRGISFPELAEVIGLRPKSVRARLMRHGRRRLESGMKPYRGAEPDQQALMSRAWAAGKP